MNAAEILEVAGVDSDALRDLLRPIRPEEVGVRSAPALMRRLWGEEVGAMTLRSTVFLDPTLLGGDPRSLGLLVIHELAHARQWRVLGVIGFTLRYVSDYLNGRLHHKSHREAYLAIGLEVEARSFATRFR